MAKSASVMEDSPESESKPRVAKAPRKARAVAEGSALAPATSNMKPVLIGLGVGAAVAATALVVGAQLRGGRSTRSNTPSIGGMVMKAALFALTRVVVQRAATALTESATLRLADLWEQRQQA